MKIRTQRGAIEKRIMLCRLRQYDARSQAELSWWTRKADEYLDAWRKVRDIELIMEWRKAGLL